MHVWMVKLNNDITPVRVEADSCKMEAGGALAFYVLVSDPDRKGIKALKQSIAYGPTAWFSVTPEQKE